MYHIDLRARGILGGDRNSWWEREHKKYLEEKARKEMQEHRQRAPTATGHAHTAHISPAEEISGSELQTYLSKKYPEYKDVTPEKAHPYIANDTREVDRIKVNGGNGSENGGNGSESEYSLSGGGYVNETFGYTKQYELQNKVIMDSPTLEFTGVGAFDAAGSAFMRNQSWNVMRLFGRAAVPDVNCLRRPYVRWAWCSKILNASTASLLDIWMGNTASLKINALIVEALERRKKHRYILLQKNSNSSSNA